jgi:hypothetical protein
MYLNSSFIFFFIHQKGVVLDQFLTKFFSLNCFFHSFPLNKCFLYILSFFLCGFVVLLQCCVDRHRSAALFYFSVLVRCLFGSNWQIKFDFVHIQSMTLISLTLQTRRHVYYEHSNFGMFVDFVTFVDILEWPIFEGNF